MPRADDDGPPSEAAARSILVVEDDPELRELFRDVLEGEGFTVEVASNGAVAHARLRRPPLPALVILDLVMPGVDGWDLHARMRSDPALQELPIVVMSALEKGRDNAAMLGAKDFLAKPLSAADLVRVARRYT